MPEKKYYVYIPGTTEPTVLSQGDYDVKKDKLYEAYPDANVVEMQGYNAGEEIGDSDFFINIPGTTQPTQISAKDFAAKQDKIYAAYPDVQVSRIRQVDYYGDKLKEIYDREAELKAELEGLPAETDAANLRNMDDDDLIHEAGRVSREKAGLFRRGQINRELDQLYRMREENPAWKRYWAGVNADIDEDAARIEQMQGDLRNEHMESARHSENAMRLATRGPQSMGLAAVEMLRSDPEYNSQNESLAAARLMLRDAKEAATAPSRYGGDDKGAWSDFWRGVRGGAPEALSEAQLVRSGLNMHLVDAIKKIQDAEGKDTSILELVKDEKFDGISYLNPGEKELVKAFVKKAEVEGGRGDTISRSYQAGKGAVQSLGFMLDFYMMGGAGEKAADAVAGKLVKSAVRNELAKIGAESLYGLVKASAMTPLMPSTYNNIMNNILQFNDAGGVDLSGKAVASAVGDALIENISETIGSMPLELIGLPLSKVNFPNWAKAMRNSPVAAAFRQFGYHGLFEELVEEWTGNALRVMTGVDKDALKDFATIDQQLITLGSFAPMSLFGAPLTTAQYISASRSLKKAGTALQTVIDRIDGASLNDDEKAALKAMLDTKSDKTPEELAHQMAGVYQQIVENGGDAATAYKAVMDYVQADSQYKVMTGVFEEQKDIERGRRLTELNTQMGNENWHHTWNNGVSFVRIITDADGNERFVTAEDEGALALVDRQGNKSFLSASDLAVGVADGTLTDNGEQELFDYLDKQTDIKKKADDGQRMELEQLQNQNELMKRAQPGTEVNLGTVENPMQGTIVQFSGGKFIVQGADGSIREFDQQEMANILELPLTPVSQEQQEAADADELVRRDNLRDRANAMVGRNFAPVLGKEGDLELVQVHRAVEHKNGLWYQVDYRDSNGEIAIYILTEDELNALVGMEEQTPVVDVAEQTEQVAPAPADDTPRDFRGNPLPMRTNKKTGQQTVDQNALWNKDPEAWARWNDTNPNQRVTSKERLEYTLTELNKEIEKDTKAVQKAALKGIDEDEMDNMEAALGAKLDRRELLQSILNKYNLPAEAGATIAGEQRKAAAEQVKREQLAGFPGIQQKWNDTPKAIGAPDEIRLPNGETVTGKYVLTEATAPTASHNPANGFAMTEGFPVDENGKTVNDRDYERDKDAQTSVLDKAANYDQRALQTPVIVSADGVVLSGNDRTMASQIAAANNTDGAYLDYLNKYPQKYGFTAEQVKQFAHPRVVFVPDTAMPYNAATFAKFNAEEKKSQSKTEKAVKAGKTLNAESLGALASLVDRYDDINALYNSKDGVNELLNILLSAEVISQEQVAALRDGDTLSGTGMDLLESTLIGAALDEEAVRIAMSDKSIRKSVVSAISQILVGNTLNDYNLRTELTDAITLVANGKALGEIKFGESVQDYIRQQHLFMDDVVAEASVQLLADAINDRKTSFLKKVLSLYNRDAVESANGQMSLLTGDVLGREAILRNILEYLGYDTRIIYDTSERAAEQRGPAEPAEPAGPVAPAEAGQAPAPVQGGEGSEVDRAQYDREEVAVILEQGNVGEYNLADYMTDEEVAEFIRRWEAFLPSNDALGEAYNRLDADLHSGDKKKKKAAQAEIDRLEQAQVEAHAPVQEFVDGLIEKYGQPEAEEGEEEPIDAEYPEDGDVEEIPDEEEVGEDEIPEVEEDEGDEEPEPPKGKKVKKGKKGGKKAKTEKKLPPLFTGKHSDADFAAVEYTTDEVEQLIYGASLFGEYTSKKTGEKIEIVYSDDAHPVYNDHQVRFWIWQKGAEYGERREAVVTTDFMMRYLKVNGFKLTNPTAKKNKYGYWVNKHGVIVNPIRVALPSTHKGWANMNYVSFAQNDKGKWTTGASFHTATGGYSGPVSGGNNREGFDTKTEAVKYLIQSAEKYLNANYKGGKSKTYEQRDLENLINTLKTKTLPQAMLEEGVVETVMRVDLSDAGIEGTQGDLFGGEVVEEPVAEAPSVKEKPKKESKSKKKTAKRKAEPGVNLFGEEVVEAPEDTDEDNEPRFQIEDEEGTPGNFHWVEERVCTNPQILTITGAERLGSVPKVALAEKDGKWYAATYVVADGGNGSAWGSEIPSFKSQFIPYNSRKEAIQKAVEYMRYLLNDKARKVSHYGETFNETKNLIDYLVKMELPKEEEEAERVHIASRTEALVKIKEALDTFATSGNHARVARTLGVYVAAFDDEVEHEINAILSDLRKNGISKESKDEMVRRVAELYNRLVNPEVVNEVDEGVEEPVAPARAEKPAAPAYGSQNKMVTTEKYEELKKQMLKKLGQLNAGFDPETFFIGAQMAVYHVEAGARKFVDFAQRMIKDLGDAIRPYLKAIYNGARDLPGMEELRKDMDSAADVEAIDVDAITIEEPTAAEETPVPEESTELPEVEEKEWPFSQEELDALKEGDRVTYNGVATTITQRRDFDEHAYRFRVEGYNGDVYPWEIGPATNEPAEAPAAPVVQQVDVNALFGAVNDMYRGKRSEVKLSEFAKPVQEETATETAEETKDIPNNEETPEANETEATVQTLGEIGKYTHTKTGKEMSIVRLTGDRVSADEFKQLKARAKEFGGYYSSYGGAKGFLFENEADAIKFNTINAPENAEEQTDVETAADTAALVSEAASVAVEAESLAENEAPGEQEAAEVITRIDDALEAIDDQLALLGYYEADTSDEKSFHESYGYMKSAEKKAVKDADKLAKRLANDLGINVGRKKLAVANIAPAGGDISFRLPLNGGMELYVDIELRPVNGDDLQIRGMAYPNARMLDIMYRVENPSASGQDRYVTSNNFAPYNVSYSDLLNGIRSVAKNYLPQAPATAEQEGPVDVLQVAKEQAEKNRKSAKKSVSSQEEGDAALGGLFDTLNDAEEPDAVEEVNTDAPAARVKPTEVNGYTIGEKVQYRPSQGDRSPQTATIYDFEYDGRPVLDTGLAPVLYEVVDWEQVSKIEQEPVNETDNASSSEQPQGVPAGAGSQGEEAGQESAGSDRSGEGGRERDLHGRSRSLRPRYDDSVKRNTRNNRVAKGEVVYPKTPSARFKANIAAIRLLKELQDSGKDATKEQMAVLRQYTGWGGLGGYFNNEYSAEHRELKSLLTDEEMAAAALSINTAYYTPVEVIDNMWEVAKRLGFEGGNILEGSAGTGAILASMPKAISERSAITAVELDNITGGILRLLYPDATVHVQGFQETDIDNGSIDLAITNVPFGDINVYDSKEKDITRKFGGKIHDFCIAKNIRKLAPGGLGIFISTRGTLDNSSKTLRQWIVNEGDADVIGAFRLNNETFEGTGATSDIIVVRKRVNGNVSPNAIDVTDTQITRREDYELSKTEWNPKTRSYERIQGKAAMEINSYFVEHPENMGGEMGFGFEHKDEYRPGSSALWPSEKIDQNKRLAKWAKQFSSMKAEEQAVRTEAEPAVVEDSNATKEGQLVTNSKGEICISRSGKAIPIGVNAQKVKGYSKAQVLSDYDALKNAINEVLDYQLKNESDEGLKPLLSKLNRAYDTFAHRYSRLNRNTAISFLRNDVDFPAIAAVEDYKEKKSIDGKVKIEVKKTSIFSGRVLGAKRVPTPNDAKDGVIVSMNQFGRIDVPFIADALNKDDDTVRKEILDSGLGFENPQTGGIEVEYEYLSGNVREKLEYAREHNTEGKYDKNISALEKVVPADIPAHLIEFSLGSDWMPVELYTGYAKEKFDVNDNFKPFMLGGSWAISDNEWDMNVRTEKNRAAGVTSNILNSTKRGHELMLAAMNNSSIVFSRTYKDSVTGQTITESDKEATQAATQKMSEMRDDFKEWARAKMLDDPDLAQRVAKVYNDTFNAIVPKEIKSTFLPEHFEGMATKLNNGKELHLREHQAKAVIRGTTEPLMLAHEVGTGKTFTLIATAMEMRRLGTAKKPMIVVQNATLGQFVSSAKELYPNAKVLTISEADRTVEGRTAFYAKIKYNDWDMIIVPQSVFEMIPDSEERQRAFIQEKIEEKEFILEQAKQANNSSAERQLKKELEDLQYEYQYGEKPPKKGKKDAKKEAEAKANAVAKAKKQLDRRTDDVSDFDDMGIDALLVDEAHSYKHLGFSTAMQRGVKGVDSTGSKKSAGVYLKTRAVFDKAGWKNVVFATGTPISNTAAEIWTFMKYLMPDDVMRQNHIYYFDDFVRNFGNIAQSLEFTTSGKFKENTRFASYTNLPELIRIWWSVCDTVRSEDAVAEGGAKLEDKQPKMENWTGADGREHVNQARDIYLPQSGSLVDIMNAVRSKLEWYESLSGKEKKEYSYIPLTMFGIAKMAAIDPRLVDRDAPDEPNSKTNKAVEETLKALKDSERYHGTCALFCDNFRRWDTDAAGRRAEGFNIFEEIKRKLVEAGVPEDQIVIMKSGMNTALKEKIFARVNAGEVRVIMGTTATLGTGVNIQERLFFEAHLDAPNRPMDYTQRNGRILRQGNLHRDWGIPVRVVRFGVEDSLDVTAYQRLSTKSKFIDSVMNGKPLLANGMDNRVLEEAEEGEFDNPVAVLSGSQYALLKSQAERELRKIRNKKEQYRQDQIYIDRTLKENDLRIAYDKQLIDEASKHLATVKSAFPDGKVKEILIEGKKVNGLGEVGEIVKEKITGPLRELVERRRNDRGFTNEDKVYKMKFDGYVVDVEVSIERTMQWNDKTYENKPVMSTRVSYSCKPLGIVSRWFLGGMNGIKDIPQEFINEFASGRYFEQGIMNLENTIARLNSDNDLMLQRRGKPFAEEEKLQKQEEIVKDYTEKMKAEMAEKEKKYADIAKNASGSFNLDDVEVDEDEDGEGEGETHNREADNGPRINVDDPVEVARVSAAVNRLAKRLGLNVHVIADKNSDEKGFYQEGRHDVTVNIAACNNLGDALNTLLHEGVGHYGLRLLLGEQGMRDFLNDVVLGSPSRSIRRKIERMAAKNGWTMEYAAEEYVAEMATRTDYDKADMNLWQRILFEIRAAISQLVGIDLTARQITDNTIREALRSSYFNLEETAHMVAEDVEVENTELESANLPATRKEAKDALRIMNAEIAEKNPEGTPYYQNEQTGIHVYVSMENATHIMMNKSRGEGLARIQIIGAIDKIIEKAAYLRQDFVRDNESYHTKRVFIFYAPVSIDGQQMSVRLVIKEFDRGRYEIDQFNLYHADVEVQKMTPAAPGSEVLSHAAKAISKYKVSDLIFSDNRIDQTIFENSGFNEDLDGEVHYRKVTDKSLLAKLENGPTETGYRNVAMNADGSFGSPMAGKLGKRGGKSVSTSSFALNEWEMAEENPDMATEDGKINLIKPQGRGNVDGVDYNPYIHIRPTMLNRQFTQAWKRPELVYVETSYPSSELSSGYHAEKAKLSVGRHPWNGGELILSRYDKPMRIVPWDEVAEDWVAEYANTGVTFDIVPPELLPILAQRGVEILPPKKAAGADALRAYNEWHDNNPSGPGSGRKIASDLYDRYENQNGEDKPWLSENEFLDMVERELPRNAETKPLLDMIDQYRSLAEEDFNEGRRDFSGGEMEDMFNDFLSMLQGYASGRPVRNRVAGVEGFISNAEAAVNAIQMEKATPQQWLKMIEGKGGLKAGEDKWIGLSDWLNAPGRKSKTITKQEVLNHIAQTKIQIEEVAYTDAENIPMGGDNEWDQVVEQRYGRDIFSAFRFYPGDGGTSTEFVDEDVAADVYRRLQHDYDYDYQIVTPNEGQPYSRLDMYWMKQIAERIADYGDGQMRIKYGNTINPTRLSYTTSGLSNKREIALTVPTIEPWKKSDNTHFGDAGEGRAVAWVRFGETNTMNTDKELTEDERYVAGKRLRQALRTKSEGEYAVEHFTGRRQEDGRKQLEVASKVLSELYEKYGIKPEDEYNRVLVIDEIQSKRHQEARDRGYSRKQTADEVIEEAKTESKYRSLVQPMIDKYGIGVVNPDNFRGWREVTEEDRAVLEEAERLRLRVQELQEIETKGVPEAPFEKNWHELAMKRMLRLAAEEGYDYVAWTTGDQQAERYNIGNVVNSIEVSRWGEDANGYYLDEELGKNARSVLIDVSNQDKTIELICDKNGQVVDGWSEYRGKNLSEIVGKELAKRLLSAEGKQKFGGENLRFGAEGMKGFYDEILPRFMNKYGKKWGVKVEDIYLPNVEADARIMHAVRITPEMRESVKQGQMMFRFIGENGAARADAASPIERRMETVEVPRKGLAKLFGSKKFKTIETAVTRIDNLNTAKKMQADGIRPEDIKRATGWEVGRDGKWRYEESDVSINEDFLQHIQGKSLDELSSETYPLGQVLKDGHEKDMLFTEYPELSEINVSFYNDSWFDFSNLTRGYYNPVTKKLMLNPKGAGWLFTKKPDAKEMSSTMLHEIQHVIQHIEGFAQGGNTSIVDKYGNIAELKSRQEQIAQRIEEILNSDDKYRELNERYQRIKDEESDAYKEHKKKWDDAVAKYNAEEEEHKRRWKETEDRIAEVMKSNREKRMSDEEAANELKKQSEIRKKLLSNRRPYPRYEWFDGRMRKYTADEIMPIMREAEARKKEVIDNSEEVQSLKKEGESLKEKISNEQYRLYQSISGEVEARNVQKRMDMTDEERRNTLAESTEDVERASQIILADETANRSMGDKRSAAMEIANKFGVEIEFRPSSEMRFNGKPLAGRWINGKMYICPEHCRDNDDAVRTVLHEGVGHNGLRRLIGDENMREFCLDLFRSLPKAVRNKIASDAVTKYGGNVVESVERFAANDVIREVGKEAMFESTEEWLAETSETIDYDNYRRNVWDIIRDALRRVLAKVGINVPLSMRDVKWLMVQSSVANHETDPLVEARRQVVANALGFTLRQQAEKAEAVQLARNRIAEQHLAEAARIYNKDVLYWFNRLHETWVDKDNAVHQLVKAIEKATGKAAKAFEDIRLSLNQQSSKGLAAIEKFERECWNPMQEAIRSLMDEKGIDLHAVERYVMIKHGLERNEVFAKRDAREFYQDAHDTAVSAIENSDKIDDFTKKALIAKEDAKLTKHIDAVNAGSDVKYLELRKQDYGGLTAMYSEYDPIEPFMEGVESEEEYQARVLQSRHPKYTYIDEAGREQVDMAATEEAAQQEVNEFENGYDDAVKELWKRINAATKFTLKHQYDANMMSRDQYQAVSGMFKYYVPLRGFADNTAEDMYDYYQSDQRNDFTPPLLKAKGRKTEAESPFGYIGSMASSGIAADMKNETKLALYYFVSNRAKNDLVTISEVWYKNTGVDEFGHRIFTPVYPPFNEDLSSEEAKRAYEDWEKQMQEEAKAGFAFKGGKKLNLKNSVIHIDERQKTSHVIKFKVGGRDLMMYINGNPRAAQAINNELNVEMSTDYQKVFGKVLRWFSGINTSYNPEFWLSNAQRDILFALMSVNVKEDPEYNAAFRKNLGQLVKATLTPGKKGGAYSLKKKLDDGKLGDERLDRLYQEFVENGGVTGYTTLKNNEEWELELRKFTGDQKKAMQAVKTVFEKVQNFGEAIEQMTRFAAYTTSREQGKEIKDAVNDAKELTVNFNRKGSGKAISFKEAARLRTKDGKKLTALQKAFVVGASWLPVYGRRFIMFFNASTQGLNAMYKLYKKNGKGMALWTAGYLALGVIQAAIHALLDDDDDYLDIPDYERRNNLLLGGGGFYFKWAIPQEARVFYAIGDMAVNHALGREPNKDSFGGWTGEIASVLSDIAPLNPTGGLSALAPSALTPIVEVAMNRDYKGAKIFNDLRYLSDEERKRTPAYQRAYQGTGKVYVLLSQSLNWMTGGDYADAGWINPVNNPAAWEHILQGATGGAGTTIGKFYRGTIGQVLGEDFTVRNTPFLSRLLTVTDDRYRNAHTTELFDYYKAVAEHTKILINTYRKNGDDKKLDRLYESEDYEIMTIYDSYKSQFNYYNDELKATTDKKDRKALMREQDAVRKEMIMEISNIGKND